MKVEVCLYCSWVTQQLTVLLVGKIVHQTNPLMEARPNDRLGITSLSEYPPQSVPGHTQELTTNVSCSTGAQEAIVRRREEALDRRNSGVLIKPVPDVSRLYDHLHEPNGEP